jgi:DNA (cytosine-5)-methyltransferase 1
MKFLSICSGIEAASVAWNPLGWQASGFSEIEPFPCAVLAHHYPDVPNHGNMMMLPNKIRAGEVEAPDLLCGGTPCQAFSVAGLRQSLDDARGNLSLTFCEIADAIDSARISTERKPAIIFWENVPGVLNTKDNAFGCFLGALAGEDDALVAPRGRWANAGFVDGPKRAVAWRVLDAQYFGVAQRRRRVFVIASARADFDPAAVLFEFEGMRGDSAPSREKRQETARVVAPSLTASNNPSRSPQSSEITQQVYSVLQATDSVAKCLITKTRLDSETETFIALAENTIGRQPENGGNGNGFTEGGPMYTLNATGVHGVAHPIAFEPGKLKRLGYGYAEPGLCPTLRADAGDNQLAVAQPIGLDEEHNAMIDAYGTLLARTTGGGFEGSVMQTNMAVRRLTAIECERLQGFPDNYTNIPWRKSEESPDGPRYKALGNSWAVPVVRWIGERIARSLA